MQFDVFSKQILEIQVHKSVNSSRVRNPRKSFPHLLESGRLSRVITPVAEALPEEDGAFVRHVIETQL
jgi:hypothetical protein